MRHLRPALALIFATTLALTSACGDDGSGGQGEASGAKLTMFAFSSSPAEDAVLRKAIDDYNKRGKNTVELKVLPEYDTALTTALAGGAPPDVFYVNDNKLPDLGKSGALEAIGDQVDNPGDFYDTLKQSFTYQGTYYCAPKDFSTLQLVYNTADFQAANLKPPTTWEELATTAKALTKPGHPGLVLAPEFYRWGAFFAQAGAWPTDDNVTKMTMDTPQMKTALQYLTDNHKAGSFATPAAVGAGWGGEAFGKGLTSMTVEGNWIVGAMKNDFPSTKYAVAELPAGPAGKGTMSFSVCYGVAKASKNKAASLDLVKFLTSPDEQLTITKEFPVMPSRKSLADKWLADKPELKAFVSGADYAKKSVFVPGFSTVIETFNDGIQGLAKGNRQVDEVVTGTQKAGSSVLG
ncbi:ABC transporter substrate-binding protein [Dactylosporangium vinaceum]|uniref:Extracellular solute-binding protein n=1 Tax=Dactylosporangium vinaceum TaxID=53362 RepID=A0ABV5MRK4_9ACTN|nr:ABC transporter substrate-binding protein [Dactylosporangium vinaceum]UAC00422.1 ABC transporter substrate-binding protein [Dactylosporangium vinaceum]